MRGRCPQCGKLHNVRVPKGDKLANHECETCHVPLKADARGRSRGRYMCPVWGDVVTLGQTGVQLERPMRLTWKPGKVGRHEYRTEPDPYDAQRLKSLAGRVLGPGCVVSDHYDPDRERSAYWDEAAGLRLVDADDPGDPDTWIVNQPLVYRACAACGSHIPDLPEHRVPPEWTPSRALATKGRSQYSRRTVPVDQGPHPADTLACPDCHPGESRTLPAGQQPTGSAGPPCGNNPNFQLSPGDQLAVDGFKAYLQRRRAGGPPERDPWTQTPSPRPEQEEEA